MAVHIVKYTKGLDALNSYYCGRSKAYLGLGNPFGYKPRDSSVWKVDSLADCLFSYRRWLYKIVVLYLEHCSTDPLQHDPIALELEEWEVGYVLRVIDLADRIKTGEVTSLVCWCVDILNYTECSDVEEICHTQILYKCCMWLNRLGIS